MALFDAPERGGYDAFRLLAYGLDTEELASLVDDVNLPVAIRHALRGYLTALDTYVQVQGNTSRDDPYDPALYDLEPVALERVRAGAFFGFFKGVELELARLLGSP